MDTDLGNRGHLRSNVDHMKPWPPDGPTPGNQGRHNSRIIPVSGLLIELEQSEVMVPCESAQHGCLLRSEPALSCQGLNPKEEATGGGP